MLNPLVGLFLATHDLFICQIDAKVQQAAMAVGLDGDGFYTKAGELSGGMRRRLSIAMSLVGDPPIIFMDGMYEFLFRGL